MKKVKRNCSTNHNQDCDTDVQDAQDFTSLFLLENRIYKSMLALKKYGDIPLYLDGLDLISQEFKKGIELIKKGNADGLSVRMKVFDYCMPVLEKKNPKEIDEYIGEIYRKKIQEKDILEYCHKGCGYLIYFINNNDRKTDKERMFNICKDILMHKSYEAIGYWTAKLEEMKRNKKSIKKRTDTKEEHKDKLKEMMKTMKPKEYRLKAQKDFGKTERTILNWLKEIKAEKTALLRKNKDTA